ncbi:Hsp20/alpha crystallin family protein [Methanobacterium sp. VT]|uniref:Hsp20/alpha crystallin family protein n=1 Tax=Methanobacterium spitsbergense TaxID=2874285 RepID=A0A8T5USM4_9EURY|nr:Hsp20/alpha crystallin family protein [Methanobacterium spitsbergense]
MNKSSEVKKIALEKKSDLKDKALEVKKGALEKTADAKESALMKTSEIKENAGEKTAEIKADTSDKTAEFRENAEKTRKQAERKINEFISTLKDKQEEFGKTISDYTSQKPLTDVLETENSYIIKVDLPRIKKENINVNITEDSVEIQAKFDEEDETLEFIKKERSYGDTSRIIPLPEKIEVKKASAKFEDAVLTVELPKVQEEKIKVKID